MTGGEVTAGEITGGEVTAGETTGGEATAGEMRPTRCELTPPQVEGPFYFGLDNTRTDMTGGRAGVPLQLNIAILDVSCLPISDALVEVWHADAAGVYSGFPNQGVDTTGEDFLRGEVVTNSEGNAQFNTIYPGWYPGRAVHIHFKVTVEGQLQVTSQLYLPDEISRSVYMEADYQDRGEQDTLVNRDRFFNGAEGKERLMATVDANSSGYQAYLEIVV